MNYESCTRIESRIRPGVAFVISRMSFERRMDLIRRIRELSLKCEFLKAGQSAEDKLQSALLSGEIDRVAVLSFLTDGLLSASNLTNVLSQSAVVAIAAIGATFVILTGGIDLSTGSVIGAGGVAGAWIITGTGSVALGDRGRAGDRDGDRPAGRAGGGAVNVVPFAVTLAALYVVSGCTTLLSHGRTIAPVPAGFIRFSIERARRRPGRGVAGGRALRPGPDRAHAHRLGPQGRARRGEPRGRADRRRERRAEPGRASTRWPGSSRRPRAWC